MNIVFDEIIIDFEKSHGSYLVDKKTNKEYLDFYNMFSSLPLGYNHPVFNEEFRQKISSIGYMRMANMVCHSKELQVFSREFEKHLFLGTLFYCCTGALAVETALKCAMHQKKRDKHKILSVKNSFHGVNSWGLPTDRGGATEGRMDYFPSHEDFLILELDEIIRLLEEENSNDITAVLIEPIQCTGGDIYLSMEKLQEIRHLCSKKNICFILDEIQTGFGTTGKMWYYEFLGFEPDILIFGKKSQVCGVVVNEAYGDIFNDKRYKLDVTFNGELLDIVRASYILKAFQEYNILDNVQKISMELKRIIEPYVLNYRSLGCLIAFDFESPFVRDAFVSRCYSEKLLINKGGEKSVRLRPNLALNTGEIEYFEAIFSKVMREVF